MKTKILVLFGLMLVLTGCGDSSSDSKATSSAWFRVAPLGNSCDTTRADPLFPVWGHATCNTHNLQYLYQSRCDAHDKAEVLCGNE